MAAYKYADFTRNVNRGEPTRPKTMLRGPLAILHAKLPLDAVTPMEMQIVYSVIATWQKYTIP
jgi:hypothetical protein